MEREVGLSCARVGGGGGKGGEGGWDVSAPTPCRRCTCAPAHWAARSASTDTTHPHVGVAREVVDHRVHAKGAPRADGDDERKDVGLDVHPVAQAALDDAPRHVRRAGGVGGLQGWRNVEYRTVNLGAVLQGTARPRRRAGPPTRRRVAEPRTPSRAPRGRAAHTPSGSPQRHAENAPVLAAWSRASRAAQPTHEGVFNERVLLLLKSITDSDSEVETRRRTLRRRDSSTQTRTPEVRGLCDIVMPALRAAAPPPAAAPPRTWRRTACPAAATRPRRPSAGATPARCCRAC